MGSIQILDDHLANQIAAGEVVERPASIVKELIENAVDAKATRITIDAEEGGIELIRVADNGVGMKPTDVSLAFERHATSKILKERDLYAIRTLGFRGEALPSIASVAKVTLVTSCDPSRPARRIELAGGKVIKEDDTSRAQGTEVEIRSLFYNTPARLKYLKTVNTEVSHIADVVTRLALAHPKVAFQFRHQQKSLIQTSGDGNRLHVIYGIYGKQVTQQMFSIEEKNLDFDLQGFFTKPEVTRSNRSYITLLINGRYVRNVMVTQQILRAYGHYLPTGRYPIGILHVDMDPKLVDVNVHPAKLEVRFSKEKELCHLIEQGIKNGMRPFHLAVRPSSPKPFFPPPSKKGSVRQEQLRISNHPKEQPRVPDRIREAPPTSSKPPEELDVQPEVGYQTKPMVQSVKYREDKPKPKWPSMDPLTQIHGTYIVAQSEDGFYVLDQHAAHERIYYEQFSKQMSQQESHSIQPLLIPITVECTPDEAEVIRVHLQELSSWGIQLEPFGGTTFLIRSQPSWFPEAKEQEVIHDVIELFKQKGRLDISALRDESAKMMSCKAAIKANRYLRREEMEQLLDQLQQCDQPFTCPHGRPIFVHFSTYELEKMFKRVM